MTTETTTTKKRRFHWMRIIGLLLLGLLLWHVDVDALVQVMRQVDGRIVVLAIAFNVPMVLCKSLRWQTLLNAQHIQYGTVQAYLAYFGAIFIGLLTPGRVGEFIKAMHVSRDCNVSSATAFSGVLTDRLFDLVALLVVGGAALLALALGDTAVLVLALAVVMLVGPFVVFLNDRLFGYVQSAALRLGRLGRTLLGEGSWLLEMRSGMRQVSLRSTVLAVMLTVLAYIIFFGQCYLLALALGLPLGFIDVSYAVALGSLVTLLPISISGLGTREVAIIAYLGTMGIASEAALGFSLLIFTTFYLGGGLIGALAWWIKPAPLMRPQSAD